MNLESYVTDNFSFEAFLLQLHKLVYFVVKNMCIHELNEFPISAVQTPGFSPPAPAPAKKTPAPGKKLRLRQKTCEN